MKKIKNKLVIATFLVPITLAPLTVYAQVLPRSIEPDRQRNDIQQKIAPAQPNVQPATRTQVVVDVNQKMETSFFTLKKFSIQGVTAYSQSYLSSLSAASLNKRVSVAEMLKIAGALQKKYLDDGYTLTRVTIEKLDPNSGEVIVGVTEGYVAQVQTKGEILQGPAIDDAIKRIKAMHPLNTRKLERIMLLLNDLPGTKLSSVLARMPEPNANPGAIRLILESTPAARIRGSLALNDGGSQYSGPLQAIGTASIASLGINYSDLDLAAVSAFPTSELAYGSIGYTVPVFGISGTMLSLNGSATSTEPGDNLKDLDIEGKSYQSGLGISYPIIRQRDMTWKIDSSFNIKNSTNDLLGTQIYDDRLRVLTIGTNYSGFDRLNGTDQARLSFSQGLNILGARKSGSDDLSRQDGKSDFQKFEGQLNHRQPLPQNFELSGTVSGQYSFDPLLSAEEIGFGGSQLGRGYDPSEITGDRGLLGSVELRYNTQWQNSQTLLQPYLFYDIGKVWNIDLGAHDQISAASTGTGVRTQFAQGWSTDLNLAFPLTKDQQNPPSYTSPDGPRVLFSVLRSFN